MLKDNVNWRGSVLYAWRMQPEIPAESAPVTVLLHGAGNADSSRCIPLASALARTGLAALSFDFYGQGQSPGDIHDTCLLDRVDQAVTVVDKYYSGESKIVVVAYSMSAHIGLRLCAVYGNRISALALLCPAVYSLQAESALFGPAFTKVIRAPESWRSSPAFDAARQFMGRAVVVIGHEDTVIPKGVVSGLVTSLIENASELRLDILPNVDHQLAGWMQHNPRYCDELAHILAKGVASRG